LNGEKEKAEELSVERGRRPLGAFVVPTDSAGKKGKILFRKKKGGEKEDRNELNTGDKTGA